MHKVKLSPNIRPRVTVKMPLVDNGKPCIDKTCLDTATAINEAKDPNKADSKIRIESLSVNNLAVMGGTTISVKNRKTPTALKEPIAVKDVWLIRITFKKNVPSPKFLAKIGSNE